MRRYMYRYMRRYMYIHNRIHIHNRDHYCYLRNLIAFCYSNASNASNECVANIMIYVSYHFLI
jgi:hypothetical protein